MQLTLLISEALLCASMQCWPVLIGPMTEQFIGKEYPLVRRITEDPGYGGEVLQFTETESVVFAIHRVWTLRKEEERELRLLSKNPRDRFITRGCVNVDPALYVYLAENFTTLKIKP